MGIADLIYKDPSDRFKEIAAVGASGPAAEAEGGAVSSEAIAAIIQQERQANGTAEDISTAVSRHVALHSKLTEPEVQQLIAPALAGGSDSASAKAVSAAALTAGVSGNVSMSYACPHGCKSEGTASSCYP